MIQHLVRPVRALHVVNHFRLHFLRPFHFFFPDSANSSSCRVHHFLYNYWRAQSFLLLPLLLTKNGVPLSMDFYLWEKEEVAGSKIMWGGEREHAEWCFYRTKTALQPKHYEMVHCLDANSTHFSTIPATSFSLVHRTRQVRPLGTHCATQHPGYWRKNQMALNFKWLVQPFFALGESGDFQYTDCCFVSRSYVNIQVSPQVITDFNKSSSFRVHCKRSEQIFPS